MNQPSLTAALPDLPYDYGALEPSISGQIMQLHHDKHHRAYVTNLNLALEKYLDCSAKSDLPGMLNQLQAIKFNGGGHLNHSIFWTNLAPADKGGGAPPVGNLAEQIAGDIGDLPQLQERMSQAAIAIQGSGWAWLGYCKNARRLVITTTANQDPLPPATIPLLGIDVWEHAYYLQYRNARPDYVRAIWGCVAWQNVADRLAVAKH